MVCEYGKGLKVVYDGSLYITKGEEIDVFVKDSELSTHFRDELESARTHNSCDELWAVGKELTDRIGYFAHID